MAPLLDKHLPLHSNSSRSSTLQAERKKDHYSHFILRLAFSSTEDLRRRFSRLESMLFRLRYRLDDTRERQEFVDSLDFAWEMVSEKERLELADELRASTGPVRKGEDDGFFKVEWEKVPELVEHRRVLLKRGMAYVPVREQMSLVLSEFTKRLDDALEVRQTSVHESPTNQCRSLRAHSRVWTKMIVSHQFWLIYHNHLPLRMRHTTLQLLFRLTSIRLPPTLTSSRLTFHYACLTCINLFESIRI
jgi:DNA primase large subunit